MKNHKTRLVSRTFSTATVEYRGRQRPVVVELHLDSGFIEMRLEGCRRRKRYAAIDLATLKPSTPQLMLPL